MTQKQKFQVRLFSDTQNSENAQKFLYITQQLNAVKKRYENDPKSFVNYNYDRHGVRVLSTRRPSLNDVLESTYNQLTSNKNIPKFLFNGLTKVPQIGGAISMLEPFMGLEASVQRDFGQFDQTLDEMFLNMDNHSLYEDLIEQAQEEVLGYGIGDNHDSHEAVSSMENLLVSSDNSQRLSSLNNQFKTTLKSFDDFIQNESDEKNKKAEIERINQEFVEADASMRLISYSFRLFGDPEQAKYASFAYQTTSELLRLAKMVKTASVDGNDVPFSVLASGYVGVAIMVTDFIFASNSSQGEHYSQALLEAIQNLGEHMDKRFDSLEDLIGSVDLKLDDLLYGQFVTHEKLDEIKYRLSKLRIKVDNIPGVIENNKYKDILDRCENLILSKSPIQNQRQDYNNKLLCFNDHIRLFLIGGSKRDSISKLVTAYNNFYEFLKEYSNTTPSQSINQLLAFAELRRNFYTQNNQNEKAKALTPPVLGYKMPNIFLFKKYISLYRLYKSELYVETLNDGVAETVNLVETEITHFEKTYQWIEETVVPELKSTLAREFLDLYGSYDNELTTYLIKRAGVNFYRISSNLDKFLIDPYIPQEVLKNNTSWPFFNFDLVDPYVNVDAQTTDEELLEKYQKLYTKIQSKIEYDSKISYFFENPKDKDFFGPARDRYYLYPYKEGQYENGYEASHTSVQNRGAQPHLSLIFLLDKKDDNHIKLFVRQIEKALPGIMNVYKLKDIYDDGTIYKYKVPLMDVMAYSRSAYHSYRIILIPKYAFEEGASEKVVRITIHNIWKPEAGYYLIKGGNRYYNDLMSIFNENKWKSHLDLAGTFGRAFSSQIIQGSKSYKTFYENRDYFMLGTRARETSKDHLIKINTFLKALIHIDTQFGDFKKCDFEKKYFKQLSHPDLTQITIPFYNLTMRSSKSLCK